MKNRADIIVTEVEGQHQLIGSRITIICATVCCKWLNGKGVEASIG